MSGVYLALYKGRKSGRRPKDLLARLADWAVRKATNSPYSHCEIAIAREDGCYGCFSASLRDGGVRFKAMELPAEKWDLFMLPENTAQSVADFYKRTKCAPYDYLGVLGVVFKTRHSVKKWFCSEWCAAALGLCDAHTCTPARLARRYGLVQRLWPHQFQAAER